MDILTPDIKNNTVNLDEIKKKIDEETYEMVVRFLKNGKKPKDISNFLEIDIDLINYINK